MKILLYADVHFSQKSSIVTEMGNKYHKRLENCIESINWAENLATTLNCDEIITLGDFFDKPELNAEEITAVKDIKWSNLPHTFIVGNHESNISNLMWSSTMCLKLDNFTIVDTPTTRELNDIQLCLLPYIVEEDRKSLNEYFSQTIKRRVILSHNDIKGIQYGVITSKEGFDINDINDNCDLFLNGHLHNGSWINNKILNVGNLTGQNFTEDAFKYKHCVYVLDTTTLELTCYENPIAMRFYNIEIKREKDISKLEQLDKNAVVSIKCDETLLQSLKSEIHHIEEQPKIVSNDKTIFLKTPRIIVTHNDIETASELDVSQLQVDNHLHQLELFVLDKLGNNEIVLEELKRICEE